MRRSGLVLRSDGVVGAGMRARALRALGGLRPLVLASHPCDAV